MGAGTACRRPRRAAPRGAENELVTDHRPTRSGSEKGP